MLRDLWRTIFLMSFASQIYCDEAGSIYLANTGARDGTPKFIHQIPDRPTLDLLMRETCWAGTHTALAFLVFILSAGLVRLGGLHWAWLGVLVVPLALMLWIGQRGQAAALSRCPRLTAKEVSLDLTRAADLADLEGVTLVRICAVLTILLAFAGYVTESVSLGPELSTGLDGPLMGASLLLTLSAFNLIVAGGHVLNPNRLHLEPENTSASPR